MAVYYPYDLGVRAAGAVEAQWADDVLDEQLQAVDLEQCGICMQWERG